MAGSRAAALRVLSGSIQAEALTMTYADLFFILAAGIMCVIPLVLFLRPLPSNAPSVAAH
jgi:DHA2 family multidrug resistance protein